MDKYPHIYKAKASAAPMGDVLVSSPGLEKIESCAPPEFGGSGGKWSPETLLVASVVDCFVLSFRAISRASKFEWSGLECDAEGKLENFNRVTRFTSFDLKATLRVPAGSRKERAELLLRKAENGCLITNSLIADIHLQILVEEDSGQPKA